MLEQGMGHLIVALERDHMCQLGERTSNTSLVTNLLEDGHALLEQWASGGIVALLEGQLSCETERIGDPS